MDVLGIFSLRSSNKIFNFCDVFQSIASFRFGENSRSAFFVFARICFVSCLLSALICSLLGIFFVTVLEGF